MNKLLFHEGGQPLHLDDLSFMQSSYSDPLRQIALSLGTCYLGGCHITVDKETSEHRWTDGYIAYQGNIYKVDAGTLGQVDMSDTLYWLFEDWTEGEKTLENGQEEATKHIYKAKLVATREMPSQPNAESYIMPRLGEDIARRPWRKFSFSGAGVHVVDFTELSMYSGVLTLAFSGDIPLKGDLGTFTLSDVGNMYGQTKLHSGEVTVTENITIELINGKLYARQGERTDGAVVSSRRLTGKVYTTLFITWDFLTSSGTIRPAENLTREERAAIENDKRYGYTGATSSGYGRIVGDRR